MLHAPAQRTVAHTVHFSGVALHSGRQVEMAIKPGAADTGIVFERLDVDAEIALVPARYDAVCETTLGTTVINRYRTTVQTVEHLMAALWGCGIDNAHITLAGPEIPIMDGSSEPFVFLLECAGTRELDAPRRVLEILQPVSVKDGDSTARIVPAEQFGLDVSIEFRHAAIGCQRATYDFEQSNFKRSLSRARTFGFANDVARLRELGLAQGGSLANAVVLSDDKVLNEEGLRYNDEFVRHKALDCVGDYFLCGGFLKGFVTTSRPGHGINNKLLRAIFADEANYRWLGSDELGFAIPALADFATQPAYAA